MPDTSEGLPNISRFELILDAICGVEVLSCDVCHYMEKRGLMKFTGNQHNLEWKWRRDYIRDRFWLLGIERMIAFYCELKRRQANDWKADGADGVDTVDVAEESSSDKQD
jgi:hypothetical protein